MKKAYKLLAFLITPITVFAQPVLNSPEMYNTNGMIIKRVICEPVAAGPAGANQTWDFTQLVETGDTMIQHAMPAIPGNPFPLANLALHTPADSMYTHIQQTTSESLQWGVIDSSSNDGTMIYSDPMLMMRRPLTFEDTATDAFAYTTTFGGTLPVEATGNLSVEADAYGTIYLPYDTFENVIRIRVEHQEEDSITGVGTLVFNNVFHVWYSDESASPVFRVDSINLSGIITAEFVDVQYLAYEAEVTSAKNITSAKKVQCSAHLSDRSLLVSGSFETGKHYELALFNINGQEIMKRSFNADGQSKQFVLDQLVASGTYILTVRQKGDIHSMNVIKLVKQ